jgi:transcriptional regulator with XRE-family HTH domain
MYYYAGMSSAIDREILSIKAALESRRGDWQSIATRAQVSHSWLSKFVNGHIPNPGVETLKAVRAALVSRARG